METINRNTAYKIWIASLINGNYIKGQEQFESGYIEFNSEKISRVNLVGGVIDKNSAEKYVSVNLDDGSGIISLRAWNENMDLFLDVNIGDLILVIGKLKEYNNRIYVTPEIVRKLDNPLWLKVRKLELVRSYGDVKRVESMGVVEGQEFSSPVNEDDMTTVVEEKMEDSSGNFRSVLLGLIESLDSGNGADVNEVLKKSGLGENGRDTVQDLIKSGEIFELGMGKLRIMG